MLSRVGGRYTGIGAAVLAVALLLAGCSGAEDPEQGATAVPTGGPVAPTESAEPTPSGGSGESEEPTEPVPEPSPVPKPERPAAMDDTGEQGAIAAAQYFFELYNHVQSTGETALLDQIGTGQCSACISLSERIAAIYADGGYMTGGVVSLQDLEAKPTVDGLGWEVQYTMLTSAMTVVKGDGSADEYPELIEPGARMAVTVNDGRWWVAQIYAGGTA